MQIDYVITWVNGQDPQHKTLRRRYQMEEQKTKSSTNNPNEKFEQSFENITKARFQDNGEIYYNIASVLKYAPFIRKIFIVTDNQTPALLESFIDEKLCPANFLNIISHDEIFANNTDFPNLNAARPTFNSRSIESVLWRIKGLAEHFIFSNDDFFLNAPVSEKTFFANGQPRIFGDWKNARAKQLTYFYRNFLTSVFNYRPYASYSSAIWMGAKLAGIKGGKFLSIEHRPHPLRKSTLERFFKMHQSMLQKQVAFRFRSFRQFNTVSLANHLELKAGVKPEKSLDMAYLNELKSHSEYLEILDKMRNNLTEFGCIQDFGLYPIDTQKALHELLVNKFSTTLPQKIKQNLLEINT